MFVCVVFSLKDKEGQIKEMHRQLMNEKEAAKKLDRERTKVQMGKR